MTPRKTDGGIGVDFSFLTRRDQKKSALDVAAERMRRIMNDRIETIIAHEGPDNVKEVQHQMRGRCPTSRVVRRDGACVDVMLTPDESFTLWDVTVRHLTAEEAVDHPLAVKESMVKLLTNAERLRDAITPRKETPSRAESESPLLPGVKGTRHE